MLTDSIEESVEIYNLFTLGGDSFASEISGNNPTLHGFNQRVLQRASVLRKRHIG